MSVETLMECFEDPGVDRSLLHRNKQGPFLHPWCPCLLRILGKLQTFGKLLIVLIDLRNTRTCSTNVPEPPRNCNVQYIFQFNTRIPDCAHGWVDELLVHTHSQAAACWLVWPSPFIVQSRKSQVERGGGGGDEGVGRRPGWFL